MSVYETAQYKVLEKDGKFEIRAYENYYTAAVVEPNVIETSGFNQIFDYINGNNAKQEKISMTTPVINELQGGRYTTEFVMPGKYSEEKPPDPMNDRITIRKNTDKLCASFTFSGTVNEEKIHQHEDELKVWLDTRKIETIGDFRLARYNPPFIPPAFRRNEILIDIVMVV